MSDRTDYATPVLVGTGAPGHDTVRSIEMVIPSEAVNIQVYPHRKWEEDPSPWGDTTRVWFGRTPDVGHGVFTPYTTTNTARGIVITCTYRNWTHDRQRWATIEVRYDVPAG